MSLEFCDPFINQHRDFCIANILNPPKQLDTIGRSWHTFNGSLDKPLLSHYKDGQLHHTWKYRRGYLIIPEFQLTYVHATRSNPPNLPKIMVLFIIMHTDNKFTLINLDMQIATLKIHNVKYIDVYKGNIPILTTLLSFDLNTSMTFNTVLTPWCIHNNALRVNNFDSSRMFPIVHI